MAPRKRFNPVEFYRKAASTKPLSVKAPKTRHTPATTAQLSTIGHLFDKAAGPLADYIKGEREEKRSAAERADQATTVEMIKALTAPQTPFDPAKYGISPEELKAAAHAAFPGPGREVDRKFYIDAAKEKQTAYDQETPYGADLVIKRQEAGDYNIKDNRNWWGKFIGEDKPEGMASGARDLMTRILLGDKEKKDAEKAAELKRSQKMEDYIKQQKYKAFAPQGEKRTKEYKNAIAMGLTPGTEPFNDYIREASRVVAEAPNPLLTGHATNLSKTFADWSKKGRAAPGFLAKLGDLRGVLKSGVDQGFGQRFLNNAAALSIRMGWKVNEANLTGAQVADSLINQLVVPRVKDLGAKPTDKDLQFIIDIFPNISNQPGANELILQVLELDSKRNIARAEFLSKWLKENVKTDRYGLDFFAKLQVFENSNDIFKKFVPPGWVKQKSSSGKKLPPVPAGYTR
jgi:hypothetical protein